MYNHTLQNILIKDPVSWAQVKPLEYAKQATTEQNPKFQTQTTDEAHRSRMPQTRPSPTWTPNTAKAILTQITECVPFNDGKTLHKRFQLVWRP